MNTMFEHLEESQGRDIYLLGGVEGGGIGRRVAQRSSGTGEHSSKSVHLSLSCLLLSLMENGKWEWLGEEEKC